MIAEETHNEIQEKFIHKGIKFFGIHDRGYFDLAMRFGKCRVAIEIMKHLHPPIILIAYPDNKLKTTWEDEMVKWDFSHPLVYYTNFSSLKKWTGLNPDLFIIDEFHAASPNERDLCHQIATGRVGIKSLALSGTVTAETAGLWGFRQIGRYSTNEGIESGILADYQITIHLVNLDDTILSPTKKGKYLSEKKKYENLSYVITQSMREGKNAMFLALARNRLSLGSIGKMTFLRSLLRDLKGKRVLVFTGLAEVADGIGIPSYHSKSKSEDNFDDFKAGKIDHLALAAMGKVGVTYPDLDSVIMLNFTYNKAETSQILNRAIKLDYKGKVADLHIICLNEPPELKKIKESLSMLDQKKIKWK